MNNRSFTSKKTLFKNSELRHRRSKKYSKCILLTLEVLERVFNNQSDFKVLVVYFIARTTIIMHQYNNA